MARALDLADDAFVFSKTPDGSAPWLPNDVTKVFIRVRNRAQLPGVRLDDLRHFTASRMLAAGVPVRRVSGRLGLANAATTLGATPTSSKRRTARQRRLPSTQHTSMNRGEGMDHPP